MKYIHIFTFQFSTKIASYVIQSDNRILPFTQLEKLADEQHIDLATALLINQSIFLNEEDN